MDKTCAVEPVHARFKKLSAGDLPPENHTVPVDAWRIATLTRAGISNLHSAIHYRRFLPLQHPIYASDRFSATCGVAAVLQDRSDPFFIPTGLCT